MREAVSVRAGGRALAKTVTLLLLAAPLLAAQPGRPSAAAERVRAYRVAHETEILRELSGFLALPNLASVSFNIRRNADHLVGMMERRGIRARLLESKGSPPAVYGELLSPGAKRTVVFYAHYDGQPVDAAAWASDPWKPVLLDKPLPEGGREIPLSSARDGPADDRRLYARSASDDKSPIVAMMAALDALAASNIPRSVNLKFFFEGEEEAGSSHLREMLEKHAGLLKADLWLFCDGPVHQTGRMQVVYGVRGVMGLEITAYGPERPLHSGHYGNWAPNPISLLTMLLASMRDADGRVLVAGFYDDVRPLSESERRAITVVPSIDADLRRSLSLAASEAENAPLSERITQPALNFRGVRSGYVGPSATNAIPSDARASIDFRLVPNQTPEHVRQQIEAHITKQGFHIVHDSADQATRRSHQRVVRLEWERGYPGIRTSMELPESRAVQQVVAEAVGAPILAVPTLGGSLPMYIFAEVLKVPLIVLPIVNYDNNQHAANENLRLGNLWDGMEIFAALMARLGHVWRQDATRAPR